jgi:hypothetical protein
MILKTIKKYIEEGIKNNFLALFAFLFFIGFTRNMLEMVGYFTKSSNYAGYFPVLSSFFDTISYVFLMIIAEGYLINLFFNGTKEQLRSLLREGSRLLFWLFILIPLLNNIFNYHFFYLPIAYNLGFIHPALSIINHYGPVGINTAFLIVMLGFPFWIRKFYNCSLSKSFLIIWPFYIVHYIITYPLMIEFSWGGLAHYNLLLHTLTPLNAYTFWFLIMVLLIFPFFMIDYPINEKEKKQTKIVYFVLWLMLISLFFIGGPY